MGLLLSFLMAGAGVDGSATKEAERVEPTLDIGIPASIPEEYIEDLPARLRMYQRIVTLGTAQG